MRVRAKPGQATIKASPHLGAVIIEDNFPAVDPARQLGRGNFHLRRFVARHLRVRNRDTPEPRRTEVGRVEQPGSHIRPCNSPHPEFADHSIPRIPSGFFPVLAA